MSAFLHSRPQKNAESVPAQPRTTWREGLSAQVRNKLAQLKLSNQAVIDREHRREKEFGKIPSPWYIRFPFKVLCWTLDVFYDGRPIQR